MIEVNKQPKKRTSKTNPEYMQKKAMIIEEKLNNPNIKILELEKKY
jgi:hypothetical protein